MLLIIIWYFFTIIFGLGLGLKLEKLTSASASTYWPRLTSLQNTRLDNFSSTPATQPHPYI